MIPTGRTQAGHSFIFLPAPSTPSPVALVAFLEASLIFPPVLAALSVTFWGIVRSASQGCGTTKISPSPFVLSSGTIKLSFLPALNSSTSFSELNSTFILE